MSCARYVTVKEYSRFPRQIITQAWINICVLMSLKTAHLWISPTKDYSKQLNFSNSLLMALHFNLFFFCKRLVPIKVMMCPIQMAILF